MFTAVLGSYASSKRHRKALLFYSINMGAMFIGFIAVYGILIGYLGVFKDYHSEFSAKYSLYGSEKEKLRDVNDFQIGLWNGCCVKRYSSPKARNVTSVNAKCNASSKFWPCIYGESNMNPGPVTCDFLEVLDIFGAHAVGDPAKEQGCGVYPLKLLEQYFNATTGTRDEFLRRFQDALYSWFDNHMTPYVTLMLVIGITMFISIIMALCVRTGTDPREIANDNEIKRMSMEMPQRTTGMPPLEGYSSEIAAQSGVGINALSQV